MAAPVKKSMSAKKRKLGDLTVDEFMMGDLESSSSESSGAKKKFNHGKGGIKGKKPTKSPGKAHGVVSKHKASLERLKDQDPEFFEFLKDEDESLLKFGDMSGSDVSDSSDDDDEDTNASSTNGKFDDDNNDDSCDSDDGSEDEEDDFPMSSDEEISQKSITKFLEKKNEEEIEKAKKAAMEGGPSAKGPKKTKFNEEESGLTKLKAKGQSLGLNKKNESKEKGANSKTVMDNKEKMAGKNEKKEKGKEEKKDVETKLQSKQSKTEDSSGSGDDDDDDEGGEEFDMDESDDSDDDMVHKPSEDLEVMSDSDDDLEEEAGVTGKKPGGKIVVSMKMIKEWTQRFKEKPSPALLHEAVHAFKAAVQHTATEVGSTKYKVTGAKGPGDARKMTQSIMVYNAVVRMCLIEIPTALQKILDLPKTTDLQKPVLPSSKDKRWIKVRLDMKNYLGDVLKLLTGLSEANMVNVLLKHVHKLVSFYACFPKLTKTVLKKVVNIWSSSEETSRVLAFLCINRLIRINQELHLENCIKQMYMAYVRNCKFTSPNTLPMINFMQRSFIEILALDFNLAYQYAFVYIRQLAIHLRNAITTKKKESCQAVYNWQFIHCLGLWSRVLSATHPNEVLEPLIYPLVQTIIGTVKLIPTQRYYPLRFHCVKALTMISRSTRTFVPVLPFLLEIFEQTDFNKKHKTASIRPINFATILKFSKPQLLDKTFKDGVIDQLYEHLLEEFHAHAHTIGFPELALPALMQLKEFLKKCKVGNFTKQMKQIVDKVDENGKFITARRRTANISIADDKEVDRWERECLEAVPPLVKFYTTWRKMRDRELMHRIAAKDTVFGKELPEVKKPIKGGQKATDEEKKEFSALFDSDDDDNAADLTESFLPPEEKKKLAKERKQKEKTKKGKVQEDDDDDDNIDDDDDDDEDIEDDDALYEDFDSDELEQLAGSGSDDGSDVEYDDGKDHGDDITDDVSKDNDEEEEDDDDDEDDDGDAVDDDIPEGEDIVKDFTMSSDEDD